MTESAESQFQQAQLFLKSNPPAYAAALPFLQNAAAAGHAEAAFQLGGCILYGMGTEPNHVQATYWLKVAADNGHQTARYNLALLREGNGIHEDDIVPIYLQLAEEGYLDAQIRLMHYYAEHGDSRAVIWAQKAAKRHHPHAQLFLAQHHQNGQTPDLPTAHMLYQQAAAQGMVHAHWQLANQFLYGQGVAQNDTQALYHLRIAAKANIAPAQTALAKLLLEGKHIEAAPEEAIKWLNKAVRRHDNDARALLAHQYMIGIHLERDYKQAAFYALQAARHNHPEALRLLGDIYQYGLGIPASPQKARRYYERAAKHGDLTARHKLLLADALQHTNHSEYSTEHIEYHRTAERNYQAGFAHHYGIGCPQDYASAIMFYNLAASSGHAKAQTNLGMMYYNGQGVATNHRQAAYWFLQAAHQGDTIAQYNIACLCHRGLGVPQNTAAACSWLQTAIDNGHEHPDQLRAIMAQWQSA